MRNSEVAEEASQWLCGRLETYGHSFADRQASGLPNFHDFEFVDQIWLNLLPLYFRDSTVILDRAGYNLGHWNLHQGKLELQGGLAYFNGIRVVMAHFSGLPSREELDLVTYHSNLYTKNRCIPWAVLAKNYLDRLERAKKNSPSIPYSYSNIQPGYRKEEEKQASRVSLSPTKSFPKRVLQKVAGGLQSSSKIVGGVKLLSWQITRSFQTAQAILINRGEDQIFRDRSLVARHFDTRSLGELNLRDCRKILVYTVDIYGTCG
jgi:hypothetical protein